MERLSGFTALHVHGLTFKDDFCEFALDIRRELLAFTGWTEMRQDSHDVKHLLNPARQNGITTGHLSEKHRTRLPHCLRFVDLLESHLPALCAIAGVHDREDPSELSLEINAMAYGEGSWLSAHTDSGTTKHEDDRLIAWMLYLTHPDDGEWQRAKGGAVRLWDPESTEARLCPKFNRFAMFRVSQRSFHEIEAINWPTGWERCRLALSGWIRGSVPFPEKDMHVYLRSNDYARRRAAVETKLQGARALYRLLLQQREFGGMDTVAARQTLEDYNHDYEAHLKSPDGTSFVQRAPGPKGWMTIIDEQQQVSYLGSRAGYTSTSVTITAQP